MDRILLGLFALGFVLVSVLLWQGPWSQTPGDSIIDGVEAPKALVEHSNEFDKPQIIQVTQGVHVAVGFAVANSILLEGPDGLVIVDTTESKDAAQEILQQFRNISSKPIKAIVYTHSHPDHCRGVMGFIENPNNPPDIIAHELFDETYEKQTVTGKYIYKYAIYQMGTTLHDEARVNCGLGYKMRIKIGKSFHQPPPNVLVHGDWKEVDIAGLHLVFVHIPGETPDQLGVWLPDRKILMPGDDIYKSFPNLYAIRGTPPRDVQVWADSMFKMAALRPKYLVPSHTRPIIGEEDIYDMLMTYGNAIQFVHDQTVRYINKFVHPDQIAKLVKLPKRLAMHSHLAEFYGTVKWSVKSVYNQYLGWFSGDPVELFPLLPQEKAQRMVNLVGASQLLQSAREALDQDDLQWGLELASYVFRVLPSSSQALSLRLEALRKLASRQISANGRHFYLTAALEDHGKIDWFNDISEVVTHSSVKKILHNLKTRLKAEEADGVKMKLVFNFTDISEAYCLTLEDSVLKMHTSKEEIPSGVDVTVTTTTTLWKDIILKKANPVSAYITGGLIVDGGLWNLKKFMDFFETNT